MPSNERAGEMSSGAISGGGGGALPPYPQGRRPSVRVRPSVFGLGVHSEAFILIECATFGFGGSGEERRKRRASLTLPRRASTLVSRRLKRTRDPFEMRLLKRDESGQQL